MKGAGLKELINHFGLTKEYYSFDYQNVHFIAFAKEEEYLDIIMIKQKNN
jgi:hypothetical protein